MKNITVIGGADGPTSVFLAGKIGNGTDIVLATGAVLIIAITICMVCFMIKRK